MNEGKILITAPSLDTKKNVSGISSVVKFIIENNTKQQYRHFELGRKDNEKRNVIWFFRIIKTSIRWIFVVSSKQIVLVHFNFALCTASIIRDVPLILFAKLIRKKIIIHLHGGEYLIEKKAPKWMYFFLKRVFTNKTQILVLSPVEQKTLADNYNLKNVKALPNCVDLKEANEFNRKINNNEDLKLLFLGRIRVDKGIEYIYQALILLKEREIPFTFYMAGAGPDEEEYLKKFTLLLEDRFKFLGVVSGQNKTALLKNCDIFLLPSYFPEGLPMALLESMSFGLVPIVSGIGSIKFVVTSGVNGVIVDQKPATEIFSAIEKLNLDRTLLFIFSERARSVIYKNYDPENYILELNKVYEAA